MTMLFYEYEAVVEHLSRIRYPAHINVVKEGGETSKRLYVRNEAQAKAEFEAIMKRKGYGEFSYCLLETEHHKEGDEGGHTPKGRL